VTSTWDMLQLVAGRSPAFASYARIRPDKLNEACPTKSTLRNECKLDVTIQK